MTDEQVGKINSRLEEIAAAVTMAGWFIFFGLILNAVSATVSVANVTPVSTRASTLPVPDNLLHASGGNVAAYADLQQLPHLSGYVENRGVCPE